ncbi:MAG TPA: hypothetical protein VFB12_13920 [Ktedonobacteraceae bacterium]|nr:hypothetical protein [Ktedonobacteraceae bacterium]
MSDQNMDQARALARKLGERVKSDPSFKEQVQKDPHGTLTAEGLSEQYVGDFLRETQMDDVAGYSSHTICLATCVIWSI